MSICSAIASASSTSMPKYLTALSTLVVAEDQLKPAPTPWFVVNRSSPQRMGAEQGRLETDAGDPLG
jgi:hypothetical protein